MAYQFTKTWAQIWALLNNAMQIGVDYVTAGKASGTSLGTKATAEGNNTTASGNYSHAEGYGTQATTAATHAEGYQTTASALYTHAEGYRTLADEQSAHAEGDVTTASGYASHSEGTGTTASGSCAHAEGDSTVASSDASHAEGGHTTASGQYSHAEGYMTVATGANQHVGGKYNVADGGNVYAEIIGNGTADNARSNARTLKWNGDETLAGKLTIGKHGTDPMDVATVGEALNAYATDNASGSIASFSDGADSIPMKSFLASIDPIQNLNGQSAPYPAGGGKNKAKPTLETVTQSGITYTANADGTVTCTGSSTISSVNYIKVGEVSVTNGQTYILSGCPSGGGQNSYRLDLRTGTSTIYNNAIDNGSGVTFTADADVTLDVYVRFNVSYAITGSLLFKPMVCLSTASDPDYAHYAPYSNVCPISGHSGVNAVVAGKNLISGDKKKYSINGVNLGTTLNVSNKYYVFLKAGVTYRFSGESAVACSWYFRMDYDTANRQIVNGSLTSIDASITVEKDGYARFWVYRGAGIEESDISWFQLEVGESATAFEPYNGTTYPVTFYDGADPLTVYKGYIDLVSGVLYKTHDRLDLGSKNWLAATTSHYFYAAMNSDAAKPSAGEMPNILCEAYPIVAAVSSGSALTTNPSLTYFVTDSNFRIAIKNTNYSDSDTDVLKADLGGIYLVYELDTPVPYNLTPTEVLSLLGQNNCFNDCSNTEVEYRADTKLYIDKRLEGGV